MITAAEVCTRFPLKPEAKVWLREGMRPREFVKALIAGRRYLCAIDFLAHLLPVRESVWWGCLCFQHATGGNFTEVEKVACRAAVEWVMRPDEPARVAAKAPADAAGAASIAGALAMAVYQTGGNIAPPKAPPMEPASFAWSKAVSRAVKLASAKVAPETIVETQKAFAYLGGRIAEERSWFGS